MLHVKRDPAGNIVAVARESLPWPDAAAEGWERVRGDEPDVLAFSRAITAEANPLGTTDLGLVRVLEDLIELLVERSVIRFTDLPAPAQAKLIERRGTRAALQSLRLLDGEQSDVI